MTHQGGTRGLPRWAVIGAIACSCACFVSPVSDATGIAGSPNIPYAGEMMFASNPIVPDATLPPLPDALRPMGPPKAVPASIISPLPPATGPKSGPNAGPTTTGLKSDPVANAEGSAPGAEPAASQDETTVTTPSTPFMDWVHQNQDAVNQARAARDAYKNASSSQNPATATSNPDEDLMLNIRYPYLWNQEQPPGGGGVTYTIKK